MTLYEQYLQYRLECGFDSDHAISQHVWEGCDQVSQLSMVAQMRSGALEVREANANQRKLEERFGVAW